MVLPLLLLSAGYEILTDRFVETVIIAFSVIAVALSAVWDFLWVRAADKPLHRLRRIIPQTLLLIPIAFLIESQEVWSFLVFVRQSVVLVHLAAGTERYQRYMDNLQRHPAKILVLSFVLVIALGALLLTFPRATTDGHGANPIDAVFTATSATCVTGLSTLNTVEDDHADPTRGTFTPFGQFVILILIQIGGLGIMTLSAATIMFAGRNLDFKRRALMQSLLDEQSARALRKTIRDIFVMTFVIEGLGAVFLAWRFWALDMPVGQAVWIGLFHSVSAFCNAGFSLFGDSLSGFRADGWINLIHAILIIAGGLGFVAVTALCARRTWAQGMGPGWRRLSLQIRLVVVVSLSLIVGGTILTFFLEYSHSLKDLPVGEKLLASFFQSVSFRTAGFSTIEMSDISRSMLIAACVLMFVGASPGSTGGGVKTTTVSVLFMSIRASLLGRRDVEIGKHTVNRQVVTRAISIVAIAALFLTVGFVLLLITQPHISFESLLFESVSALGTVGLSMGATSEIDTSGKLIVMVLMFVGRLGPLTVALAVGERRNVTGFRYSEERVIVG